MHHTSFITWSEQVLLVLRFKPKSIYLQRLEACGRTERPPSTFLSWRALYLNNCTADLGTPRRSRLPIQERSIFDDMIGAINIVWVCGGTNDEDPRSKWSEVHQISRTHLIVHRDKKCFHETLDFKATASLTTSHQLKVKWSKWEVEIF